MKPAASFALLIALWLFHEAQARRINKSRIRQQAESTDQACVAKDAGPNAGTCANRSVEHSTMTETNLATQPQIEVIASGDATVCAEVFLISNLVH